ncbi:glycoside hydrolase family 25 protein [Sphingobacterium psychroaquaticum]|uniref:Lysozyme n=1 Tax=Sphingobacterium psychroaquaticum TaxID=561061 RepID=A0A1X7JKH0_9SPHI|nr:glycoside hydrolase family 25 protein [Sphingobacterium psychroaquaticum]QBQ40755.1 glycoside hydrolase family 25 protein [Sphingobacterium psychroaquaticum]SMG28419.1 lysozyme [Sphingobacterium psychroaquaticum]
MARTKKVTKGKPVIQAAERKRYLIFSIGIPIAVAGVLGLIMLRTDWGFAIKNWFYGEEKVDSHTATEHDKRNLSLMQRHDDKVYGIDISQYQGNIDWDAVLKIHGAVPVDFVFVRASMGESAKDKRFRENWSEVASRTKLRGAYHYFRPNENSLKQAKNFIRLVKLKPGDLPPVLDIEERPRRQSMDSLKVGLKRWLDEVEQHYGVQPILYSGDSYFTDFLEKEFSDYVLWIANYNFWIDRPKKHWDFWQFSERGAVDGIKGNVDLNMFNGDIEDLERLTIPY